MIITSVVTIQGSKTSTIKVNSKKIVQMPWVCFLKDVLFLQLVLAFIIVFNIHGRIDYWMGLLFFALYCLYVVTSVVAAKAPAENASSASLLSASDVDGNAGKGNNEANASAEDDAEE